LPPSLFLFLTSTLVEAGTALGDLAFICVQLLGGQRLKELKREGMPYWVVDLLVKGISVFVAVIAFLVFFGQLFYKKGSPTFDAFFLVFLGVQKTTVGAVTSGISLLKSLFLNKILPTITAIWG
jgi:hypothetical protein